MLSKAPLASGVIGRSMAAGVIALGMMASVDAGQAPASSASAAAQARSAGTAVKDSWISFKIHSQFVPEDILDGSNIDVDTVKGTVTLEGTVPTDAARMRAVAIAKATDGVVGVTDKLRIAPAESAIDTTMLREAGRKTGRTITDGWVKSKVHAQFLLEDTLEDSDIDVDVDRGVVTLTGTVKSEAGRARALAIVKATAGVKSVKDALKIG